MNNRPSSITSN